MRRPRPSPAGSNPLVLFPHLPSQGSHEEDDELDDPEDADFSGCAASHPTKSGLPADRGQHDLQMALYSVGAGGVDPKPSHSK